MLTGIARAKINLYLHVTGKRPDGYHLLDSLVVFADYGDELTVESDSSLSLEISGPFSAGIRAMDDNLILKAARLLQEKAVVKKGAKIKLVKNLPVAAGIGGGSADASLALQLLNELWGTGYSDRQLAELGLSLGADVPVCLYGKPTIMAGVGELLSAGLKIPKIHIILVNCNILVSTADVFRRLEISDTPKVGLGIEGCTEVDIISALRTAGNDLQAPAFQIAPQIESVIDEIAGETECQLARMSGSGATVFGLFETSEGARKAVQNIQSRHPDWWVLATVIN
ncbi:4-(cytidine 5'-diphospho)-2-C-methyl-D-erythritol kinase [uncultured Sneathiella sp.]|uniref:4-(cytidine 5'-diphospho)-2-C-methyl-D-erythritol kinase n=1 Tax=uncultured Sneathiella sp. TaxID=879315 RepID=UPI0030EE318C|tara:strand:- start:56 stop:907 length:852 start_codon:yes stop_codon:yes gene_type:complete